MKTACEIRRDNLKAYEKSVGGREALCEKIGRTAKQMSPLIGTNPIRCIGDRLARAIEKKVGLERGWLDNPPPPSPNEYVDIRHVSADRQVVIREIASPPNKSSIKKVVNN